MFCLSASATEIGTLTSWDGSFHITALGAQTSTYGQTFSVGSTAYLNTWTFFVRDSSAPGQPNLLFDAVLTGWSSDRAVGPTLFEAKGLSVPDSDRGQFYEVTLNVGEVLLTANASYVMFLNTSNYQTSLSQKADLGATPNIYVDGEFWYQLSYNRRDNVFEYPWTCADEGNGCRYGDSAFRATLSPIPEPSVLSLLIAGLVILLRPNHSLNRTHCGVRPKARHFILDL